MKTAVHWLEDAFNSIPLPVLELWGLLGYALGLVLAVLAFGRFTLRPGGRWGLGREQQTWDAQAFLCLPLTFVLIIMSGYLGSFVVLVPGAQTLESLKDLVVLLCVVLFGFPALVVVPFAYGLSDLIEGVPPKFLLSWLPGYFINPACFWLAYQLFGKNPDFRRLRTWGSYLVFVVAFMSIEPVLWGYICRNEFGSAISYRTITPALFFTTGITWLLGPPALLGALPLARRTGLFWAEIRNHVKERGVGHATWSWEAGTGPHARSRSALGGPLPIRMVILAPFVVLVLVMVAATAYVSQTSALNQAGHLATLLQRETVKNIVQGLERQPELGAHELGANPERAAKLGLLGGVLSAEAHAFIIDRSGAPLFASTAAGDPLFESALGGVRQRLDALKKPGSSVAFHFDQVTRKPLSHTTWFAYATAYKSPELGREWIVVSVLSESFYLGSVQQGTRRSAVVFAVALVLSLLLAALLAALVSTPIRRVSRGAQALARGDLTERVPESRWEEANVLADSFNHMAARLERSFHDLLSEVETRKKRERELGASESQLRISEDRVQLAVRAAGLGVWDWDIVNDELVWDDSMFRLYGVEKQEFTKRYEGWQRCLLPDDAERATADVEAALSGEREFASEFRIRRPDGAIRVLRGTGQTFRDAEGKPTRMVGVNLDVTEQLKNEQELRQHRDHLEELVQERTNALILAKEQADAANQAKSAFLANMSHEIRTPMNAILGFGQLMQRDAELSPRDRQRVSRILASGEHLLELINNVLDMSKIEAGRMELSSTTFDLLEAISDVDAMIRGRAEAKGLGFEVQGVLDLPRYVRADVAKLRQMLLNLLGNAVKFTSSGKLGLRTRARPSERGALLTFEVEDTGTGIAADEIHKVFEPFGQTKSGVAARSGTGLGMPITRDFAMMMGGDLTVHSQPGVGTTFVLTVDVRLGSLSDLRGRSAEQRGRLAPGPKPPKVLVVDDEADNRVVLEELLSSAGFDVSVASDGVEALERFQTIKPDLIFMDIKMPRMDGVEATRRIRLLSEGARVPIVALSASVYDRESVVNSSAGASAFIAKPFREDQIFEVLETFLGVRFEPAVGSPLSAQNGEPSRDEVAALGAEGLAELRAAVASGDIDRANELLVLLESRHAPVVNAVRRRLAEFDIEGVLAFTAVQE